MKKVIALFISLLCLWSLTAQKNIGVGTSEPIAKLHIEGDSNSIQPGLFSHINYTGNADIPGIQSISKTNDGWGIGGIFEGGYIGVSGTALAGTYGGWAMGLYGSSLGSAGVRIGVYGVASGGTENWAGYFEGKGKFTDQLILDQSLHASDYISTDRNLWVGDTAFSSTIHSYFAQPWMNIKAEKDLFLTIDHPDNPAHTGVFRILNGAGGDVFAADENGNARTYGDHYIDEQLGVGTQFPSQQMDVDNGNLVVQGTNSFQTNGDRAIVYLGGPHHYIASEFGYGVRIGTYAVGDALSIRELNGDVLIGKPAQASHAAGYKLSVDGKIIGEELKIQNSGSWPDYVFEEDYDLLPLEELQKSIQISGHLPGIPSAEEVKENGIMVGDMQKRMMEKIEELTLYILDLHREVELLKVNNIRLEERLAQK